MNNQSPLVPQGSLLEQKNKGRARVKIAVFFVLAIHGIGLLALLMQGCRNDESTTAQNEQTNNAAVPTFDPTNALVADPMPNTAPQPGEQLPTVPLAATDYTVVKGDTLSSIATLNKVTLRALTDANPGIEPTKLKIGQKIHIPPPTVAAPAPVGAPGAPSAETASSEEVYTVKSGDVLSKIATLHRTTVRAIRSANNLKTDSIKVGQKLKIPKSTTVAAANPAPPVP